MWFKYWIVDQVEWNFWFNYHFEDGKRAIFRNNVDVHRLRNELVNERWPPVANERTAHSRTFDVRLIDYQMQRDVLTDDIASEEINDVLIARPSWARWA